LIKALEIYDECMEELSFYVGHTRGRVGDQAYSRALYVCELGMKAKAILDKVHNEINP